MRIAVDKACSAKFYVDSFVLKPLEFALDFVVDSMDVGQGFVTHVMSKWWFFTHLITVSM